MGRQSKQGETRATLSDIVARERQREEERRQVEAAKQGGSGKKKGEFQSLDVLQGYEERVRACTAASLRASARPFLARQRAALHDGCAVRLTRFAHVCVLSLLLLLLLECAQHHVVGSRFDRAVNKYFPKDDSKCCCCKRRTCLGILCVLLLLLAGAIALLVVFWSDVVDAFNRLW